MSKVDGPQVYVEAIKLARSKNQVIGEKSDYYITIEQLEEILHMLKEWSRQ